MHHTGFNAVVIIIYRPGSQSLFDNFNSLLEGTSIFSTSLVILSDLNVHVDDCSDVHGRKLLDVLASYNFTQHVNAPTYRLGHTLDLVITRINLPITLLLSARCYCQTRHSSSSSSTAATQLSVLRTVYHPQLAVTG